MKTAFRSLSRPTHGVIISEHVVASGQPLLLLEWAAAIFGPQGQHAARIDVNLWSEALRSARVSKLARAALQEATTVVSAVMAGQLHAKGRAGMFDVNSAASLLIAVYLGLEVQMAVGMKLNAGDLAKVLATIFADWLPRDGQAASATGSVRGSRIARRKRSVRAPSR